MPDFPQVGGATAAQVWGYATRVLTGFTGTPRSDLVGADETIYTRLDAAVSTRSSHAAADVWGVATRTITALTGTPRTDLLGEDADFEAGTGTRKARIDAAVTSRAAAADYTAARAAKIDKIQDFLEEGIGTVTANGTEQTVREYAGTGKLHAYVDLSNMAAGDTTVIRQYVKIKAAGAFVKYAEETYTDAQSLPMLHLVMKPSRHGVRITLEQTSGVNRDYDWETLVEQAA